MITSDIEEINISDLNEFEGEASTMLTENSKGLWRKVTFDPNKNTTGTCYPFSYQENEIISTTNINESYNNRISNGIQHIDMYYDFSSGIPTWGLQASDSATFRWSPSSIGGEGGDPTITGDSNGNAFVIWKHANGSILSRNYDAATQTWLPNTSLDVLGSSPDIAMSESGIVVAAWVHNAGLSRHIQAAYYDPGTATWTSNINISVPTATEDSNPRVAINDNGDGIAVWESPQFDGSVVIQAALFNGATKTWQGFPTMISNSGNSLNPKVGIDNSGNIIVIYRYEVGTSFNFTIDATYYDVVASTWSIPTIISFNPSHAFPVEFFDLSVTSNGDAMAVWLEEYTNIQKLESNKFTGSTKTWKSVPYDMALPKNNQTPVKVSMSNLGTAIAVFSDELVSVPGNYYTKAIKYNPSIDSWETPEILTQTSNINASPQIAMNDMGNAVAVWVQTDSTNYFMESSTYQEVIKKWSLPDQMSSSEQSIFSPQVIIENNLAASVWRYIGSGGAGRIAGAPGIINPNILTANDSKVSFAFRKVQEVGEPEIETDAATKFYVDNAIAAANQVFIEMLQSQGLLKEDALETMKQKSAPIKKEKNEVKKTTKKSKKGEDYDNKRHRRTQY